jgi:hypothetical protein
VTLFISWAFGLLVGAGFGLAAGRALAARRSERVVLMKQADRALRRAVRSSGRGKPGAAEDYMRLYETLIDRALPATKE